MSSTDPGRSYISYNFGTDPDSIRSRRKPVGIKFHQEELVELGTAMFLITIAFAVVFSGNHLLGGNYSLTEFLKYLPYSFIAAVTGFGIHELGHKISANYFGYPAAFSYNKKTLYLLSIFSMVTGFLVAAPGAVYIFGRPNIKENGIISAAGPMTNMVIGYISFGASFPLIIVSEYLATGAVIVGIINLIIGSFNMIPIMPLDGSKIWKWNKVIYIVMLIFLLGPVILLYTGILGMLI